MGNSPIRKKSAAKRVRKCTHGEKKTYPCDSANCEGKGNKLLCEDCCHLSKHSDVRQKKEIWFCKPCFNLEKAQDDDSDDDKKISVASKNDSA